MEVIPVQTTPPTCLICMDELPKPMNGVPGKRRQKLTYKPEDCWRLRCGHFYCVGCLSGWVESKVNERNVPIVCASLGCSREVRPPHISAFLSSTIFEKFSELVTAKAFEDQSMYCPNKECSQVFLKPDFRPGEEKTACLICKTKLCLQCGVKWHDGLDCDQYKRMIASGGDSDEAQLHALKEKMKWKQCPKCNMLVERSVGCNFMRCKCGEHFCYECGVSYVSIKPLPGHPHGKSGCECNLFPGNRAAVAAGGIEAFRERLNQFRGIPAEFREMIQDLRVNGMPAGDDLRRDIRQRLAAFARLPMGDVPAPVVAAAAPVAAPHRHQYAALPRPIPAGVVAIPANLDRRLFYQNMLGEFPPAFNPAPPALVQRPPPAVARPRHARHVAFANQMAAVAAPPSPRRMIPDNAVRQAVAAPNPAASNQRRSSRVAAHAAAMAAAAAAAPHVVVDLVQASPQRPSRKRKAAAAVPL
ncbi:Aste57867_3427 [Aphanomyces stellatus]|uniref:RBR-type E3 ubiquitin transferase n=1 Tax=Aphanomyces stellatus TaxID=120398 RepID=A0A485KE29_9STRA|nr:hypothetical protein As57867_003417 [Aphanomyces stellatus]VFT80593.1 Aste57867_3427 [Aphanomyces stellatus]